jgi:outer membrane lipoprotein carrier protein
MQPPRYRAMNKGLLGSLLAGMMSWCAAAESNVTALQHQLAQQHNTIQQFAQEVKDKQGKLLLKGRGKMALQQPNLFYWHAEQPDENIMIMDSRQVILYHPGLEQVTYLSLQQVLQSSPMAGLLANNTAAWQQFSIFKEGACYWIKPVRKQSALASLQFCFASSRLTSVLVMEVQGNRTQFTFSAQRPLTQAEQKLFQFKPPKGVQIDDQRQPATKKVTR